MSVAAAIGMIVTGTSFGSTRGSVADAGASITQALNFRAAKGEGDRADCVITRCRFQNINGLQPKL